MLAAKDHLEPAVLAHVVATPYFTNFSIDLLIRAGRVDDAMQIWRKAWGWMLDGGATTWWEVFDERWSHCHYWAGAPTWQMSRRILGADVTLHDSRPVIRIAVHPGSLQHAAGRIAFPGVGFADISWRREGDGIVYQVESQARWLLLLQGEPVECVAGVTKLRLSADGIAYVPTLMPPLLK